MGSFHTLDWGYNSNLWMVRRMILNLNGKLPHVVLSAILLQTGGAVWWASGITTTVNAQADAIKELKLSVTALTAAKIAVLESEIIRLQSELSRIRQK